MTLIVNQKAVFDPPADWAPFDYERAKERHLTYEQWRQIGSQVMKGERSHVRDPKTHQCLFAESQTKPTYTSVEVGADDDYYGEYDDMRALYPEAFERAMYGGD